MFGIRLTDPMISKNFNKQNSLSGNRNKKFLCDKFNLDPKNHCLLLLDVGGEKGAELLPEIFDKH